MGQSKKTIGQWTLIAKLGQGGNATVWEAQTASRPETVALKVLNTRRPEKESYRRFTNEIEVLRRVEDPGVLPVIDSNLPTKPSSSDRPWLAMPVATPITGALAEASLEDTVIALAMIAETLARLKERYGIAHRDIKPGNLHERNGKWLIGDFGLVDAPDLEELTKSGRPLGPAHFSASEMIRDPVNADPHAADVYSFGKTLWVLATGQNYPPSGHQPAGTRGYSIVEMRPHPYAQQLDELVDRCTLLHPEQRPTIAQVGTSLRSWLALVEREPVMFDVSDLAEAIRTKLSQELRDEDLLAQRKELAHAAVRKLQDLTKPLNLSLQQAHPHAEIDVSGDRLVQNLLKTSEFGGSPEIVFRWQRSSRLSSGSRPNKHVLRVGRSLELTEEGELIFSMLIDVGLDGVMESSYSWTSRARRAPVGSIEATQMLEDGIAELQEHLREALTSFAERLPATDS